MRTLNRPMFNWGGPVKEGIMHGIREPHNSGGRIGFQIGGGINFAKWLATLGSRAPQAGSVFSNVGKTIGGVGKTIGGVGSKIKAMSPSWLRKSISRDPVAKGLGWGYKTLTGPTAKTWAGKAMQGLGTPTGLLGAGWLGSQFIGGDDKADVVTGVMKPGGYPKAEKKTKEAQAEFAEAQKNKRVEKYLKMMGYEDAKYDAVSKALVDASKIISDRGTLEKKNITRDLINPIIQATSARLEKPKQIREAVGLMATKAEIEKDLEDPQVKKLRALQIEKGEQELGEGFETDIRNLLLSRKDKVNKKTLEQYARLTADKYGEPFTQVTDDTDLTTLDNGIYMSEDRIIRVTDGVPKRIV